MCISVIISFKNGHITHDKFTVDRCRFFQDTICNLLHFFKYPVVLRKKEKSNLLSKTLKKENQSNDVYNV